jgi:small GTP-binding protein
MRRILTDKQEELLSQVRTWLNELQEVLVRFEVAPDELAPLEHSIRRLRELFLLVVVGEFNAGKSAFINALIGQPVLEEGVTPTTRRIHLLRYGHIPGHREREGGVDVVAAPVELLREINIVDTPGTNAIQREHEAITADFVPRSDLVLFVTSADRPFTESERQFLERIRGWGKKIIFVINKIDILERPDEVAQVEAFVAENARKLLDVEPEVFAVSSRQALRAKMQENGALQTASRFEELESYIVDALDETERIKLKLYNPIGIGERLMDDAVGAIDERLTLLADDVRTIADIERQMEMYRNDMVRDFQLRRAELENLLHEFEARSVAYVDDTMRLGRIFDLMNQGLLEGEFEKKVIGDVPETVDRHITDIIDWLVARNLHQWEAVMDHLAERRTIHADRMMGRMSSTFDYDRDRLLSTVGQAARRAMRAYDRDVDALRTAQTLQRALAETALVEVGAISLGAILTTIFTTTILDVTGILAAGALAAVGLFVIPARRRKAKAELSEKISAIREELTSTLTTHFERELERSIQQINQAIAPYTRFVRAERTYLMDLRAELARIRDGLEAVTKEIEEL